MSENLHFDVQNKLQSGIRKVAKAVGSTMGTGGANVIIEVIEHPGHITTNDGYTIANSIHFDDPIEEVGRKILVESINRANKLSGDGSSTTCVLTDAVLKEGSDISGVHSMYLKHSLEEKIDVIKSALESQTIQLVDSDGVIDSTKLRQVASVSAEDEEIGTRIAEIYQQIGPKGLIYWDLSKSTEDSYTIGSGITVDGAGYSSPYFCDANENGQNTLQVRLKNPLVLVVNQKITSARDLEKIAAEMKEKDISDLVIFCDDVDPLAIPPLVQLRAASGMRIIPVKMPILWKDWWYEDICASTGATYIDPTVGISLAKTNLSHAGTVKNMVITKDDTYLDGIKDVEQYAKSIEERGSDDDKLRASRLNTKTARYYVGAPTETALSYRRLKVEDAIASAYQALNGGIVIGGGVPLWHIANSFNPLLDPGSQILAVALKAPFNRIVANTGHEPIELPADTNVGFNSKTGKLENMAEAGIFDPKNVVLNACINAISVAATVLTAPTLVTYPRD